MSFTERGDWNVTNDFELRRGGRHTYDWIVRDNESFILHLLEGRVCVPCAETQWLLERTEVYVCVQGKTVVERRASQITVLDPVLAARVDAMEQMLAHLAWALTVRGHRSRQVL